MSNIIIGITGGIGSGKTAATDYLASKNIAVIDADVVSREVVEVGSDALTTIAEHFGESILQTDGSLDRRALRDIIFTNPEEKKWLESLLHPLINESIRQQLINAESVYAILVSPLLLETQQKDLVNIVVLIDVNEVVQINRASTRDNSNADDIKKIIASQMPRAEKQELADVIIDNGSSLENLHKQLDNLHAELLATIATL